MAGKQLITEADVREMPRGGALRIDERTLATPAALDAAHARGMRVVYANAADGDAGSCSDKSKPRECLWHRVLATEGTFVVQVVNGQATVNRITAEGPVLFGTDSEAEHHG
jgi:hypothetical protein